MTTILATVRNALRSPSMTRGMLDLSRLLLPAFVLALTASPAAAQLRTRDPVGERAMWLGAELSVGTVVRRAFCPIGPIIDTTCGGDDHSPLGALTLDFTGRAASIGRAEQRLFLELDANLRFGLADSHDSTGEYDGAWVGSPWLAMAIAHRTSALTVRGALGIAPPLRSLVNGFLSAGGVLGAPWGAWDRWLTVPNVVPVGLTGMAEARLGPVDVGGDLALVVAPEFGTLDPGTFFWVAVGGWLAVDAGDVAQLGLRLHGVTTVLAADRVLTDFQATVVPFVRVLIAPAEDAPSGAVELRATLNIDEPFGPAFVGNPYVWAIALAGGASWDP